MLTTIKLGEEILSEAKKYAKAYSRSVPKQIEHWAKIGKIAEENPDLSYEFIQNILLADQEETLPYELAIDPNIQLEQTASLAKILKKLHPSARKEFDDAVCEILINPKIGEQKKGDLSHIRVHKFRMQKQLALLAYSYDEHSQIIVLKSLGSHENFYRDLKHL